MLNRLREKHSDKKLTLILGSYFDVPFGIEQFDAAVSVESLHHFTTDEKRPLYQKLQKSLKTDGFLFLRITFSYLMRKRYFTEEELLCLKAEQDIKDNEAPIILMNRYPEFC